MINPLSELRSTARAPIELARDLTAIAQALQSLPAIEEAVRPLPGLLEDARERPALARAIKVLPTVLDGLRNFPVVERLLGQLVNDLEPALVDVVRLREIIEAQSRQVTHIEEMLQRVDARTAVLEQTVVALDGKAGEAMRALPDPDDDDRGALARARDAISNAATPT